MSVSSQWGGAESTRSLLTVSQRLSSVPDLAFTCQAVLPARACSSSVVPQAQISSREWRFSHSRVQGEFMPGVSTCSHRSFHLATPLTLLSHPPPLPPLPPPPAPAPSAVLGSLRHTATPTPPRSPAAAAQPRPPALHQWGGGGGEEGGTRKMGGRGRE